MKYKVGSTSGPHCGECVNDPFQKGFMILIYAKRECDRSYTLQGLWKCNVVPLLGFMIQKDILNFKKGIWEQKGYIKELMWQINPLRRFISLVWFFTVILLRVDEGVSTNTLEVSEEFRL